MSVTISNLTAASNAIVADTDMVNATALVKTKRVALDAVTRALTNYQNQVTVLTAQQTQLQSELNAALAALSTTLQNAITTNANAV